MAIAIGLGLLFALLALGFAVFWTLGVIEGFHRDRQGVLLRGFISLLEARGMGTTVIVFGAPTPFPILYEVTHVTLSDSLSISITVIVLGLIAYCAVLWGLTLFLRFKPKQPMYIYHLPRDAEKVRRRGCEEGIWLAATTYPEMVARDWLDTFIRAIQVSARQSAFPQGKKAEIQLTNDFAIFCDLATEGCEKGYNGFIDQCRALPDQFSGVLTQIQQGDPFSEEIRTLIRTLAQQIMDNGEKPAE